MKPIVAILSLLIAACVGSAPPPSGDDGTDPPPHVKQPPAPREGGETAAGCNGVTEAGKCQDGNAVTCDIAAGALRTKDCKALGKSCVMDPSRGAKCDIVTGGGTGSGSGSGSNTPAGCGTVTVAGTCGGPNNQTATWCDVESNSIVQWDCSAETSMACIMDKPGSNIPGAFCYSSAPPPPPTTNKCPALGIEGACSSDTALDYCIGDTIHHQDCLPGEKCAVGMASGYALCMPDPLQDVSDCATIGYNGICKTDTANGTLRYCTGSGTTASPYKAKEKVCLAPQTCKVDGTGYASCAN